MQAAKPGNVTEMAGDAAMAVAFQDNNNIASLEITGKALEYNTVIPRL